MDCVINHKIENHFSGQSDALFFVGTDKVCSLAAFGLKNSS